MTDRIADPWGARTPYVPSDEASANGPWPVRVDQLLEGDLSDADVDRWVQSAAVLHSNGDGLDIAVKDGRIVGVRGTGRRSRQPRPPRSQGSLRLAGQQLRRSAAPVR